MSFKEIFSAPSYCNSCEENYFNFESYKCHNYKNTLSKNPDNITNSLKFNTIRDKIIIECLSIHPNTNLFSHCYENFKIRIDEIYQEEKFAKTIFSKYNLKLRNYIVHNNLEKFPS